MTTGATRKLASERASLLVRSSAFRRSPSPFPDRVNAELQTGHAAFTIVEVLIYLFVLLTLMTVGYGAVYRCMDHSTALRRSTDDIANALRAGENWRADVRASRGRFELQANGGEEILQMAGSRGDISYRFATNTVFRRVGGTAWSRVLANVKASSFTSDPRPNVAAWRWELELQTRARKLSRIRPLFTFIGVPAGETSK